MRIQWSEPEGFLDFQPDVPELLEISRYDQQSSLTCANPILFMDSIIDKNRMLFFTKIRRNLVSLLRSLCAMLFGRGAVLCVAFKT